MNQLALILSALCLASAATIRQPTDAFLKAGGAARIQNNRYFAVFPSEAGSPAAQQEQEHFLSQARALGVEFKERQRYNTLVNAISFEVPANKADQVAALPGIKDVFPLLTSNPPRVITKALKDPELRFAHGMTGVATAHNELGLTGKGVKVGIIDSGVDYKHPALGGCFGKGCRVVYGHDFVGDDYTGANEPQPDEDPRDCTDGKGGGHGTHVAGIVGAKDKDFVGAAPEVTYGAYRVFGCAGSTSDEVILAAIERAYTDGMDVINMSLGGTSSWADYPSALAIDSLVRRGLTVVMSAGNDGAKGLYQAQEPAISRLGMAIASADNLRYYAYGFSVNGEKYESDYSSGDEKLVLKFENTPIASAGNGKDDLACTELPSTVDLKGKVALVQRGSCTFVIKAKMAQAAGAIGVLVYNKDAGAISPAVDDPAVKIPLVGVTRKTGLDLLQYLSKNPAITLTFGQEKKAYDNPTGGKVSGFSNWGPGPELEVFPSLMGPGGLIYSTYPLAKGGYATLSGTSMSTPYVTGTIALFIQARGKFDPLRHRQIFQNTAVPTDTLGYTTPHSVFQQGAGMIDIIAAIRTPTLISPSFVGFNSTDVPTGKAKPITLTNSGKYAVTYTLRHQPALSVLPWNDKTGELLPTPVFKDMPARIEFSTKEVTLQPGQSAKVNLFFNSPTGANLADRLHVSGYIVAEHKKSYADLLSGANKVPTLRVPYGAVFGDYKKLDILSRPESGFPAIVSSKTSSKVEPGQVFALKDDAPNLIVRIIHPTKHLKVSVIDVASKKTLGQISNGDYKLLGQHDQDPTNLKMDIVWSSGQFVQDGKLVDVKDGAKYVLKVEALRPFGNEQNAASWQTWTSPEFVIDRTKATDGARLDDGGEPLEALQKLQRASRQWLALRDRLDDSVLPTANKVPTETQ
jgi:subtilisin family serine protease